MLRKKAKIQIAKKEMDEILENIKLLRNIINIHEGAISLNQKSLGNIISRLECVEKENVAKERNKKREIEIRNMYS